MPAPEVDGCFRSIAMDVDSDAGVTEGVERILREAGRIDVLVNNAGFGVAGAIEDTTVEEARAQLETNFLGTHRLCRAVLPGMREQRSGRIVNIGSLAGLVSIPFQAFYCATKYAVEAYTEALRMEVRPFGIHVSLIEPGDFATGFTSKRRMVRASGASSAYDARCRAAVGRMAADEARNADIGPVVRTVIAVVGVGAAAAALPGGESAAARDGRAAARAARELVRIAHHGQLRDPLSGGAPTRPEIYTGRGRISSAITSTNCVMRFSNG